MALAGQIAYDYREPPEWEPESEEMLACDAAEDFLRAAIRAFSMNKDADGIEAMKEAIWKLMDTRGLEQPVIDAVRSHMLCNRDVERVL